MRIPRKSATVLALVAGGSLALSACSGGGRGSSSASSSSGGSSSSGNAPANATITVAHEQEFNSYNNNTADQNAVQNAVVLNEVLRGFWDYAKDGTVKPDKEFGTYTKTKDDPLTVDYSINPKAVWSDGKPIDCADFLLTWAANSGKYASDETDENGNPTTGFSSAGTAGYDQMNKPTCKAGDKKITVSYATPFADWQGVFDSGKILPAHVLEQKSGVSDLITAIANDDKAALDKAAKSYNTLWVAKPGEIDKATMLSAGPYQLDSWQSGQSLTLTANPKWWGTPAKTKTIVVRFIDATQQAQALQNGEIQVARPQPAQDILAQLKAIGSSVKIDQGDEYTFEHLDFNFQGAMKDPDLRKAFALCVPRQQIVDNLIKPVNKGATIDNGRYFEPFQDQYKTVAAASYQGQYDKPDIAAAKALVDGKNAAGTTVRIGYQQPNQRRTDEVSLIRDSCNQAGFKVEDAGQPDFFGNGLAAGNFDVALFAWSGSPLISGNQSNYVTGGGNNNGKYTNPKVDDLTKQLLSTTSVDAQTPIIGQIEKILWDDLATIPVFAFPGLQANSTNVTGPAFQPAQSQQTWNMQDWAVGKQ